MIIFHLVHRCLCSRRYVNFVCVTNAWFARSPCLNKSAEVISFTLLLAISSIATEPFCVTSAIWHKMCINNDDKSTHKVVIINIIININFGGIQKCGKCGGYAVSYSNEIPVLYNARN